MKAYASIDKAGFGLSALCIIHCLFLPVIGIALPVIGEISEVEWLHKVFVLLAFPVGVSLLISSRSIFVRFTATLGLAFLIGGAFFPQLHDIETVVTVVGAFMLGGAHATRLLTRHHTH
ncbi:MerC domain-containing protein [Litorimonas haliclonae]|uniref:MerC domain-containing protein n=1 Tax=Litorimonas haliclonae TaxID=2081977 RepID=UPI0039F0F02D